MARASHLLPGAFWFWTVCALAQQTPPSPPPGSLHASDVLNNLSSDMETLSHAVEPAVVKIDATGLAPVDNADETLWC